jgi:pimeloyl-ACP methyl ester carboxylesterase
MLNHAKSADGTTIGWETSGEGPPLLVVHGSSRAAKHYRAMSAVLAKTFTVHVMDRRGRGASGPLREGDALEAQLADLVSVLDATKARLLFGHSAGALLSLEVAKLRTLDKLAVYEPPLPSANSWDWVPDFQRAIDRGRPGRAMALIAKGLDLGPPKWLPTFVIAVPAGLLMRSAEGREMAELMKTAKSDFAMLEELHDVPASYASIEVPTVVLEGEKSPAWLRRSAAEIARALPHGELVKIAGAAHNGPDQEAPERVGEVLAAFFSERAPR